MNKKILTLFLVVAASAILAVSCNNKTTNPVKDNTGSTTTTTPTGQEPTTTPAGGTEEAQKTKLTESDLETWLKTLTTTEAVDSATFDFSKGSFGSGTLSVESKGASGQVTAAQVKDKVIASLKKLDQSKFKVKTTIETNIFTGGTSKEALVATFEIEPASDAYVFDTNVEAVKTKVKLSLTLNGSNDWK
ncbi:hypothetical protein [Brachyspira murdochii]|uniref:hypothetical protein n=1 Tax=Brachyspira murdochii TaxID=84378 RepID=UPI0012F4DD22|nr:hypothetical protein [Brachyspira murdochii]